MIPYFVNKVFNEVYTPPQRELGRLVLGSLGPSYLARRDDHHTVSSFHFADRLSRPSLAGLWLLFRGEGRDNKRGAGERGAAYAGEITAIP